MSPLLATLIFVSSLALVLLGVALIYLPAAFIVCGVVGCIAAYDLVAKDEQSGGKS